MRKDKLIHHFRVVIGDARLALCGETDWMALQSQAHLVTCKACKRELKSAESAAKKEGTQGGTK